MDRMGAHAVVDAACFAETMRFVRAQDDERADAADAAGRTRISGSGPTGYLRDRSASQESWRLSGIVAALRNRSASQGS